MGVRECVNVRRQFSAFLALNYARAKKRFTHDNDISEVQGDSTLPT